MSHMHTREWQRLHKRGYVPGTNDDLSDTVLRALVYKSRSFQRILWGIGIAKSYTNGWCDLISSPLFFYQIGPKNTGLRQLLV